MVTKEKLKMEVDKLPDNLLEEVYSIIKKFLSKSKKKDRSITIRDFQGKLDNLNIRSSAYE